jgi:hypothetical protein
MVVVLLFLVILLSYVIVRVGAVALELTGTPWEIAKFQALSAFSNTGFTTIESEQIVSHPIRRRIITYLIVLGNAGIVTTIGTFAGALVGSTIQDAVRKVGMLALSIAALAWLARRKVLSVHLRNAFKRWLARRYDFTPSPDALLRFDQGFCLTRITVPKDSPAAGQTLAELGLNQRMIQVLAIERDGKFHPIPKGGDDLREGDELVLYATDDAVQDAFHPQVTERLSVLHVPGTKPAGG